MTAWAAKRSPVDLSLQKERKGDRTFGRGKKKTTQLGERENYLRSKSRTKTKGKEKKACASAQTKKEIKKQGGRTFSYEKRHHAV